MLIPQPMLVIFLAANSCSPKPSCLRYPEPQNTGESWTMKTHIVAGFVSLLAVGPMFLNAQPLRDYVPFRHWPAPLYWQPDHTVADFRPRVSTPTDPNPLTFIGMTPCRIVDTQAGTGFSGAFGTPSLTLVCGGGIAICPDESHGPDSEIP